VIQYDRAVNDDCTQVRLNFYGIDIDTIECEFWPLPFARFSTPQMESDVLPLMISDKFASKLNFNPTPNPFFCCRVAIPTSLIVIGNPDIE